jgi:hypothetical protein
MIELAVVIEALQAYRDRLRQRGKPSKAEAVEYCITIVKRLAK